jgi:hypothetical protein
MAIGANFDLQILANGRASLEMVAAGASNRDDFVFWMNAGFHGNLDIVGSGRIDEPSQRCAATPEIPLSPRCRKSRTPKTGPGMIFLECHHHKVFDISSSGAAAPWLVHTNCG